MRQFLLDLYEIQKIDLEIRDQEKQRDALPAELHGMQSAVGTLQAQMSALAEQRDLALQQAQALRQVVESENHKIRKWESRLNDIRNQREYQALSRETEGSKRANRDADDKIGELLKTSESCDTELELLEQRLSQAESGVKTEQHKVDKAAARCGAIIGSHTKRREVLIPRVPKPLFRKYDAIRGRRFGIGLSMVVSGCCQGCNIKLPPQLYNILQRADSIEQCPSCHRLIFWESILPQSTPADDAPATV